MPFPKHILVATDFTESAARALDVAFELATLSHGAVSVLHTYTAGRGDAADLPPTSLADAHRRLDALLRQRAGEGPKLTGSVREGNPAAVIVDVAEELGADMIVMGTHARSSTTHRVLGSVAEAVIRTANVPVVTVRAALPRSR